MKLLVFFSHVLMCPVTFKSRVSYKVLMTDPNWVHAIQCGTYSETTVLTLDRNVAIGLQCIINMQHERH
jgi:hypothetical protein